MHASSFEFKDIVNILLKRGADVNATDKNGDTALMRAAKHLHLNTVELLLEAGANALLKNNEKETALILANKDKVPSTKNANVINALKEAEKTQKKANKIHGYFDSVYNLDTDHKKETTLRKKIKSIIKSDENIINQRNPIDNGLNATIIIRAAKCGDKDIINILLCRNSNINATNNKGDTALMMAAMYYHYNVAKLLLEKKANALLINNERETALILASRTYNETLNEVRAKEKEETIQLLRDAEETQHSAKLIGALAPLPSTPEAKQENKNESISDLKHTTFKPLKSPFTVTPEIIKQIKAKQKICNITFIIFFVFVLISTPSYFYIRLKT